MPIGSDGGAWAMDPATAFTTGFVPQGIGADLIATVEGFTRTESTRSRRSRTTARQAWANGYFTGSVVPVRDMNGLTILDHDERPARHQCRGPGRLDALVRPDRAGGFDSVASRSTTG